MEWPKLSRFPTDMTILFSGKIILEREVSNPADSCIVFLIYNWMFAWKNATIQRVLSALSQVWKLQIWLQWARWHPSGRAIALLQRGVVYRRDSCGPSHRQRWEPLSCLIAKMTAGACDVIGPNDHYRYLCAKWLIKHVLHGMLVILFVLTLWTDSDLDLPNFSMFPIFWSVF